MEVKGIDTHLKKRKTRRGKKRNYRSMLQWEPLINVCGCVADFHVECRPTQSTETLDLEAQANSMSYSVHSMQHCAKATKNRKNCLRPFSPRAPHNSTQFIMDDHSDRLTSVKLGELAECGVQTGSFSPDRLQTVPMNKLLEDSEDFTKQSMCGEFSWKTSPPFADIDYEYEPLDEVVDTAAFLSYNFEEALKDAKEQDLQSKSKVELRKDIFHLKSKLDSLECHVERLQEKIGFSADIEPDQGDTEAADNKTLFSPNNCVITQLQVELMKLRCENCILMHENNVLKN